MTEIGKIGPPVRAGAPVKIHLLNLDRTPQRLAAFRSVNAHLHELERVAAVDGRSINRLALQQRGVISGPLPHYTDGAVGAALSHLRLWEQAIATGQPLTIAEDDAIFHRRFDALAPLLLDSLPADWDFVLWGWNFDSVMAFELLSGVSPCVGLFDQQRMREGAERFQDLPLKPQAFRLLRAFGLVAYTLSAQGASRLKRLCLPIGELSVFYPGINRTMPNSGIDCLLNAHYPSVNAYVCVPPLVLSKNEEEISTIQGGSSE